MVEHQPRHQGRKQLCGKRHLIHRLVVGTYLDVMPASERDGKPFADPAAQPLGLGARRRRVVIDMGMVACDLAQRSREVSFWQIAHLKKSPFSVEAARYDTP